MATPCIIQQSLARRAPQGLPQLAPLLREPPRNWKTGVLKKASTGIFLEEFLVNVDHDLYLHGINARNNNFLRP